MGRTRARTKTGRSVPGVKQELKAAGSSTGKTKTEPTISKLLQKCQELLTRCDYELASKFIERVLEMSPGNIEALEYKGIVQVETGEVDGAKETFIALLSALSQQGIHSSSPSAHLYLAQLSEDPREAIQHYQTAVDLLVNQLKGKERASNDTTMDVSQEDESRRTAIRALVSMVELYMSDLCLEPEAESRCEYYLDIALQLDPASPEALQSLASVRISQNRQPEAREIGQRAWYLWREASEDDSRSASPVALLSLAKISIELGMHSQALEVLQAIFAVDDEEVEAWYLQGWCFVLMADQAKQSGESIEELGWQELAQDARDCLESCRVLHTTQEHPDTALLSHVQELIAELEKFGVYPTLPEADTTDDNGVEEDWIDEDGEEVEMRGLGSV